MLFALIYKIMPRVHIAWRDVWIGAAVTALLFAIGKFLIGLYLGKSGVASGFGAAGSLVVLLVWVYYSAQIFLLGAEFTWVYAHHATARARVEPRPRRRRPAQQDNRPARRWRNPIAACEGSTSTARAKGSATSPRAGLDATFVIQPVAPRWVARLAMLRPIRAATGCSERDGRCCSVVHGARSASESLGFTSTRSRAMSISSLTTLSAWACWKSGSR